MYIYFTLRIILIRHHDTVLNIDDQAVLESSELNDVRINNW